MSRNLSKTLFVFIISSVLICMSPNLAQASLYERMASTLEQIDQRLTALEANQSGQSNETAAVDTEQLVRVEQSLAEFETRLSSLATDLSQITSELERLTAGWAESTEALPPPSGSLSTGSVSVGEMADVSEQVASLAGVIWELVQFLGPPLESDDAVSSEVRVSEAQN